MTATSLNRRVGYFYVILAAVLFGVSGTLSKYLFNHGMSPFQLVQLRTTISFLALFLWLGLRRRRLLKIAPGDLFYFFLLGTLGVASAQFFYLFAISKIKVAAAILLHYTGPIFIALYVAAVSRERLGLPTLLAVSGAFAGCGLVVGVYNLDLLALNSGGIVGGMLAAVSFAVYSILSEYGMRKYAPWSVLFFAMLFAALAWNVIHPPLEAFWHPYSPLQWGVILFVGIFGTVLPFGFYFEGINRIRATPASITATLEPVTAGVVAYFLLGEALQLPQILGGLMVIAAIIVVQLNPSVDPKTPAIIRTKKAMSPAEK